MNQDLLKIILLISLLKISYEQDKITDMAQICLFYQSPYYIHDTSLVYPGTQRCITCKKTFSISPEGFCYCP